MVIKGIENDYLHFTAPIKSQNFLIIIYGIILPFTMFMLMLGVKGNKKYTIGNIYDLCEFGFPFSYILCMCTGATFKMYNCQSAISLEINPLILVTPLPLLIIFLSVIEALQNDHILDTLTSFTLATGLFDLIRDSTNKYALISMILGMMAFVIRLTMFIPMVKKHVNIPSSDTVITTVPLTTHTITDEEAETTEA